jgi:hypothetical protein
MFFAGAEDRQRQELLGEVYIPTHCKYAMDGHPARWWRCLIAMGWVGR